MWTLTVSHKKRKLINAKLNQQIYDGTGTWVDADKQTDKQGFWLIPGQHVIGRNTDQHIVNGQNYTVLDAPQLQTLDGEPAVTLIDPRCV